MGRTDGRDNALFGQMRPQGVNRLGALPNKEIAGALRSSLQQTAWSDGTLLLRSPPHRPCHYFDASQKV